MLLLQKYYLFLQIYLNFFEFKLNFFTSYFKNWSKSFIRYYTLLSQWLIFLSVSYSVIYIKLKCNRLFASTRLYKKLSGWFVRIKPPVAVQQHI